MKTLRGRITLGKYMQSSETTDKAVFMEFQDETSHIQFLRLHMSLEDFAKAILGQGYIPITYELRGTENVGMILETKTIVVPTRKYPNQYTEDEITELLMDYEIDGWMADRSAFANWHRFKDGNVEVIFRRFVDENGGV